MIFKRLLISFKSSKIASKSQNRKYFSDLPVSPDIPLAPARFRKDISDMSTPKGDGEFNIYDDIRDKLVAMGIPKEEIAFRCGHIGK